MSWAWPRKKERRKERKKNNTSLQRILPTLKFLCSLVWNSPPLSATVSSKQEQGEVYHCRAGVTPWQDNFSHILSWVQLLRPAPTAPTMHIQPPPPPLVATFQQCRREYVDMIDWSWKYCKNMRERCRGGSQARIIFKNVLTSSPLTPEIESEFSFQLISGPRIYSVVWPD